MKQIVCESIRVIERGEGGAELICIWQGKKRDRQRERVGERVFSSPSLGKTSHFGMNQI